MKTVRTPSTRTSNHLKTHQLQSDEPTIIASRHGFTALAISGMPQYAEVYLQFLSFPTSPDLLGNVSICLTNEDVACLSAFCQSWLVSVVAREQSALHPYKLSD